jgi:tripartite-type tricarboxylate transporter receptor subunit TctC
MRRLAAAVVILGILQWPGIATAEVYPSRPITIIVPWPAGGPADTLARVVADRMRISLGQAVIVENVVGAGGTIGLGRLARAAANGYTLGLGDWNSIVLSAAAYPVQFDVRKDFTPVALLASNPQLLESVPAQNLTELIAWLKTNRDKVSAGTAGPGSASHVCGVYFQNRTGTSFQFVPYRGGAPLMQDLVTGQIDLVCQQASNSLPLVRGGQVKAFAVTAATRLAAAPEIPTVDEAGLPRLYVSVWSGLWAPAATPQDIVGKLNAAIVDALADRNVRERLADVGLEIPASEKQAPEALGTFHQAEIAKWWPIIKAANIKAE